MDIAMASMLQSHTQIMTNVSTAVLDMNLGTVDQLGESLIQMMERSVNPALGQNIDIRL